MNNLILSLSSSYVTVILALILIAYVSFTVNVPPFIKKAMNNDVFRVIVFGLIIFYGNYDPVFTLALALAFAMTLNYMHEEEMIEKFRARAGFNAVPVV
jgi:ABC-type amino acid transport system permease subunit